jgi:hypothetical protein
MSTRKDLDGLLWKMISKALRECIAVHGPIDNNFVGSATKRVIRNIVESPNFREQCPDDLYNKMVVDSLRLYYEQVLWDQREKVKKLQKEVSQSLKAPMNGGADKRGAKIREMNNEIQSLRSKLKKYEEGQEPKPKKPVLTDDDKTRLMAYKLWELANKPPNMDKDFWRMAEWLLYRILG